MKRISSWCFLVYVFFGAFGGSLLGADAASGAAAAEEIPSSLSENILEKDLKLRVKISFAFEYPYSFEAEYPELEAGRLELEELNRRVLAALKEGWSDTSKLAERETDRLVLDIFEKSLERMKFLDSYAMKGEALRAVILRDDRDESELCLSNEEPFPLYQNLDAATTRREIFAGFWELLVPSSFEEVKESLRSKLEEASVSEEKIVALLEKAQASFQADVAFVKENQPVFDKLLSEKKKTVVRENDFSLCEVLSKAIKLHVAASEDIQEIMMPMKGSQSHLSDVGFGGRLHLDYDSTNESTQTTGSSEEESLTEKEASFSFMVEYLKADEQELGEEFLSERAALELLEKERNEIADQLSEASERNDFEALGELQKSYEEKKQESLVALQRRLEELKRLEEKGLVEFKPYTKDMLISVKVVDRNKENPTREQHFFCYRGMDSKTSRRELFHGDLSFGGPASSSPEEKDQIEADLKSIGASDELVSFVKTKLSELENLAKTFEEENSALLSGLFGGEDRVRAENNFAVFGLISKVQEVAKKFYANGMEVLGRLSPEQLQAVARRGSGKGFSVSVSYIVYPNKKLDAEFAEIERARESMRK